MSKIVQAVNAMISNPGNITKVIQGERELFFLYRDKYKWSMREDEKGYVLLFYPGNERLETLASYVGPEWEGTNMLQYSSEEIGTKEAKASFAELYALLKESVFGVNKVLDDIISDANEM